MPIAVRDDIGHGAILRTTVSTRYASLLPGASTTAEALLASADAALYVAKRTGRNRVVAGESSETGAKVA